MDQNNNLIPLGADEDIGFDTTLRPKAFKDFVGQEQVKRNLEVFIRAAGGRDEALDHVLFYGPPGLGKTTLAHIIAAELGVGIKVTSGPVIEKAGDLAAILTNLEPRDILFIDEIHRLNHVVEEILYPAMEDFQLDIIIGQGPSARSIKIDIPNFTLVGATTRAGLLSSPLRDRFGVVERLDYYHPDDLERIIIRSAKILGIGISKGGASEIGKRSRGTPRIGNRLLRRVRDFAQVDGKSNIDEGLADRALTRLEVDKLGLDKMDRKVLSIIIDHYKGGPVGVETISAAISEQRDTIEDVIEPFLIQSGLLQRTPRGRVATEKAFRHLNRALVPGQTGALF